MNEFQKRKAAKYGTEIESYYVDAAVRVGRGSDVHAGSLRVSVVEYNGERVEIEGNPIACCAASRGTSRNTLISRDLADVTCDRKACQNRIAKKGG